MPKTSDVGVIVGRFQVHRLHEAHHQLIKSVYDTHPRTVVVLGLSPARVTHRNPLDFETRKQMLLEAFPNLTVLYIADAPDDGAWSKRLDDLLVEYLTPTQTVTLFGGRDSFIAHYHGKYPTKALEPDAYMSGTEMRKNISRQVKSSEDFRAGVIWASANSYPRVFQTVDVAIHRAINRVHEGVRGKFTDADLRAAGQDWSDDPTPREWLMVRKPNEKLWRFAGGFVQPTDSSLEMAIRREALEETGVELVSLRYIKSMLVDDWRYRSENDKIMTALFIAEYGHGPVRPADDVSEAKWFEAINPSDLVVEHAPLLNAIEQHVFGGAR